MICIFFVFLIFLPYIFVYSDHFSVNFYFGLGISFNLDPFGFRSFFFSIIAFLIVLPLITATILLIILLILCNKLSKGGVLGLGIPSAVLLIILIIIATIINFIGVQFNNYIIYIYGFVAAIIVLGLIMILKERRNSYLRVNEPSTSDIVEYKTKQSSKYQMIRLSYMIIGIFSIILLFIPLRTYYSSYNNTLQTEFYFGLSIKIDLDTLSLSAYTYRLDVLIFALPLIVATILLIILLILYKYLNVGGILGLGIPCALLFVTGPILASIFSFLYSAPIFLINFDDYYVPGLSAAIIILGIIVKIKDLRTANMGRNKGISPDKEIFELKEPTCSQCGAIIKPGSKFCIECGKEIKNIEKSIVY